MESRNRFKYMAQYLIGINVIIFVLIFLYDSSLSADTLVKFGAKVNYKIVDGQLYRLISAMFLHWDFYHLFANMLALYIFGRDIEIIFGRKKFIAIYFFAGITGGLFSFIFNNSISAGASGAIFGLLGAHLYLFFRNKEVYKRIFGIDFLVLIAINVGYGLVDSRIDFSGHMGGLIGGFIICTILGIKHEHQWNFKKISLLVITLLALGSSFLFRSTYYKVSENYFIYKSIDQFYSGEVNDSITTLQEGLQMHPNSATLQQLINEIQTVVPQ